MASKQEIFERRQKIVEILKEKRAVAVEELMELSNAKKRTIMDDIAELRKQGIEIKVGNGMVSLPKETTAVAIEPSNHRIMRQVELLLLMKNKESMTRRDLYKLCEKVLNPEQEYEDRKEEEVQLEKDLAKDRFRKAFEEDIRQLCRKNILQYSEGKLRKTFDTPVSYKLTEKDIYALLNKVAIEKHGEAYSELLEQIEQKLNNDIVYKLGEKHTFTDRVYTFEKKRSVDFNKGMALFKRVPYRERLLKIRYRTKSGAVLEKEIGVGALVYSEERAKLYLLAWTVENQQFSIYNLETIVQVEKTEGKNEYFMCREICNIVDEMFVVSVEEPYEVELEVTNVYNTREKFERLCKKRKYGKIVGTEAAAVFRYQDRIRGLDDFARYIRGFGRACRVLAPEPLAEKIMASNDEIIKMYEQYLNAREE